MVPMFSAEDFFAWKKDAKPVGWINNPDKVGPVLVDRVGYSVSSECGSRRNGMVPMKAMPLRSIHGFS